MLLHDHVENDYAVGKCDDYDICPDSGTSGIPDYGPKNKKGQGRFDSKVQRCEPGKRKPAMGVYPTRDLDDIRSGIHGGMPFRYVMPKFVCFSYPAGIDHFTITLTVCAHPPVTDSPPCRQTST